MNGAASRRRAKGPRGKRRVHGSGGRSLGSRETRSARALAEREAQPFSLPRAGEPRVLPFHPPAWHAQLPPADLRHRPLSLASPSLRARDGDGAQTPSAAGPLSYTGSPLGCTGLRKHVRLHNPARRSRQHGVRLDWSAPGVVSKNSAQHFLPPLARIGKHGSAWPGAICVSALTLSRERTDSTPWTIVKSSKRGCSWSMEDI